jgi:hypothetical protein
MTGQRACICGETADVHLFPAGWLCKVHTPAARVGKPEPDARRYCAPLRCYCGGCLPSMEHQVSDPVAVRDPGEKAVCPGRTGSGAMARRARVRVDEELAEAEYLAAAVLGAVVLPDAACQVRGCTSAGVPCRNGVWCRRHTRLMERYDGADLYVR